MGALDTSCFEPKGATELFKRGVGECLKDGGRAWVTAFAILLAPTVIAVAGQYLTWRTGAAEFLQSLRGGNVTPQSLDSGELINAILVVAGVGLVTAVLSALAQYACGAAVARMLSERALGREYGPAQALDFVLGRAGKIITGALVLLLIAVVAAVIGEIPGGIIGTVVSMGSGALKAGGQPPAIMQIAPIVTMAPVMAALAVYVTSMAAATGVENLGGFGALGRSFRLASGHFWHVLGAIALAGLAFMLPGGAVSMLTQTALAAHVREALGSANGMLVLTGVGSILSLLLTPFVFSVQATIYWDLRARQRDEDFSPYDLALELGGELPEGVVDPSAAAESEPSVVSASSSEATMSPPPNIC